MEAQQNDAPEEGDAEFAQLLQQDYSSRELGERKGWYSQSAKAYDDCRPKYPDEIMDQATKLLSGKRVLEIGCGPGTATVALAQRGYEMHCIEPNTDLIALARKNMKDYPLAQFENVAFEEAVTEGKEFDVVVAASCMHWIPAEVAYPKAAKSLRQGGTLVQLWNMQLNPNKTADLQLIKAAHAPDCLDLLTWTDEEKSLQGIRRMGNLMMDSGCFESIGSNTIRTHVTYNTAQYLGLLSSYSPYIKLAPEVRAALFDRLERCIEGKLGGTVELNYLSTYQVATKND